MRKIFVGVTALMALSCAIAGAGGLNGEAGVGDFRMYGSARRLYHFHIDNIASY